MSAAADIGHDLSQLAVVVPTLDEERNLPACLGSVAPCGQIVVVDSGSTDGTRRVAEGFGAVWTEKKWEGFAAARDAGRKLCDKPFVLFLDADETLSPGLRQEIAAAIRGPSAGETLFGFRRVSEFLGKTIRHGDWKNDRVYRLCPAARASWVGDEPHPRLDGAGLRQVMLRGELGHRPYRDEAQFAKKIESYAATAAEAAAKGGAGAPWCGEGFFRAWWRWCRCYLLRGGFADGYAGRVIARENARMVRLKYQHLSGLYKLRGVAKSG